MASRRSLKDAVHKAAEPEPAKTPETPLPSAEEGAPKQPIPPSRRGKKMIGGYFDPAVSKQLRGMALAGDTSVQALLVEAINLLFEKHGKPPIAS